VAVSDSVVSARSFFVASLGCVDLHVLLLTPLDVSAALRKFRLFDVTRRLDVLLGGLLVFRFIFGGGCGAVFVGVLGSLLGGFGGFNSGNSLTSFSIGLLPLGLSSLGASVFDRTTDIEDANLVDVDGISGRTVAGVDFDSTTDVDFTDLAEVDEQAIGKNAVVSGVADNSVVGKVTFVISWFLSFWPQDRSCTVHVHDRKLFVILL
jgi:hypothetical protein